MIKTFLTYLQCELNYSAYTVLSYAHDLEALTTYMAPEDPGNFDPRSLTVNDLRRWTASMSLQGLGFRTIRRRLAAVSSLFRYLMRQGMAQSNPVRRVPLARLPKRLPETVRSQELNELLDIPDAKFPVPAPRHSEDTPYVRQRNRLILLLLYTTGMRRGELIGLRLGDVDIAAGTLRVLGKGSKERVIPFGAELAGAIEAYRRVRTGTDSPSAPLLTRPDGKPLYPMLVERVVRTALLASGTHAARLCPHALRHSCASDLLNAGADLVSVKELLGHSSLQTTQIYTHLTYRDLQNNYQHAHPRAQKQT